MIPSNPFCVAARKNKTPLFCDVIAEAYFRERREDVFQEFLPAEEGEAGQVMTLEMQQVEDVVEQVAAPRFPVILELFEIGTSLVIHDHDFTIQNRLEVEFPQRLHNGKKLFLERNPVTGIERNSALPNLGYGPVAVPFHFKEPVRTVKRFLDRGCKHRRYCVRHRRHRRIVQAVAFQSFVKADLVDFLLAERFLRDVFELFLQRFVRYDRTVLRKDVTCGQQNGLSSSGAAMTFRPCRS